MDATSVTVMAVLGIPAAWAWCIVVARVPPELPLLDPRPGFPLPAPIHRLDAVAVYVGTVLLFVLAAASFEDPAVVGVLCFLFGVLVALSVIDARTLRLPNVIVYPALAVSLVLLPAVSLTEGASGQLTAAATGGGFYFLFLLIAHLLYPRGMGYGDVKLSLLMGLYLGWMAGEPFDAFALVLYAMVIGFALGSVAGIAVLVVRRRNAEYPFGPFLAAGAAIAILWSESLLAGR